VKKTSTAKYRIIKAVAYGMFLIGLGLSVFHIFELFYYTLNTALITSIAMPLFFDGFQFVGRIIRGEEFTRSARKIGCWLQGVGALVSLIANVVAGHSNGDKIAGVVLVVGYITIEAVAEKTRPASEDVEAIAAATAAAAAAALAAKKHAATQKALATKAANKAAKQQADAEKAQKAKERRERDALAKRVREAEIAALNADFAAKAAPVSPAPITNDEAPIASCATTYV
jgi:hypothetical protein